MKKQLSLREKILMAVLAVMVLVCVYNYAFYLPVSSQIEKLQLDSQALKEQSAVLEAEISRLEQMKQELNDILSGEAGEVKELPAYDNGKNVMNSLSGILSHADRYSVNFSDVDEEANPVRRSISLSYSCSDYETAKDILKNIHNGPYRCLIQDVSLSHGEAYEITLSVTYFEHK